MNRVDVVRLYSQHVKIHAEVLPDGDADIQPWFEQNTKNGFRLQVESLSAVSLLPVLVPELPHLIFHLQPERKKIVLYLISILCALRTRIRY